MGVYLMDKEKQNKLIRWGLTLTKEQKKYLFQSGVYNNTCKGYLMQACKAYGLSDKQTSELLAVFSEELSNTSVDDAEKVYQNGL